MTLNWAGVKERIDQHRQRYPRSRIQCLSEDEWKGMLAAKGEAEVARWYQDLVGEIVREERTLTRRVVVVRKKKQPPGENQ